MDLVVVLDDWYSNFPADRSLGFVVGEAVQNLGARYHNARFYEFLPVGTLSVERARDAEDIARVAGVSRVFEASQAFSSGSASHFYHQALSALSAIRSQSGHQRWAWGNAVAAGGIFPNENWVGGIWPPGPYPRFDSSSGELIQRDPSQILRAEPAEIPVVSLSIGQPHRLQFDTNDPLRVALTAMASTHLVVAAAGNHGPNEGSVNPWAAVDGVLSVGAMESPETLWPGSSRGSADGTIRGPDVVADGRVSSPDDVGTSYAAPRVASLGLICAAILAEANHALRNAQGMDFGVPSQALAIIDVPDETMELEARSIVPFANLPALPILALEVDLVADAFRQFQMDVEQTITPGTKAWTWQVPTSAIADIVRHAARPVPGYGAAEVGYGAVSTEGLLDYLRTVTVGELFAVLLRYQLPTGIGAERAFRFDGLETLASIVRLSRPLYVWDIKNRKFVVGPSFNFEKGTVPALQTLAIDWAEPIPRGHVARVVRATVT